MLRSWISEYINKFEEKGLFYKVEHLNNLMCRIDFSLTKKSIEKVEHIFNIRYKIEQHIKNNNFDKKYKKLNEKLVYNFDKLIKNMYVIEFKTNDNDYYQVCVFDKEDFYIHNELNNINII